MFNTNKWFLFIFRIILKYTNHLSLLGYEHKHNWYRIVRLDFPTPKKKDIKKHITYEISFSSLGRKYTGLIHPQDNTELLWGNVGINVLSVLNALLLSHGLLCRVLCFFPNYFQHSPYRGRDQFHFCCFWLRIDVTQMLGGNSTSWKVPFFIFCSGEYQDVPIAMGILLLDCSLHLFY